jgi:Xaa-Pro dipeptidase
MMCLHGEFGVRLEGHFYVNANRRVWFTEPNKNVDEPFEDVAV